MKSLLDAHGGPAGGDVLLRRVLDSLFSFVGLCRLDGTLIETNRASREAAGITLDDVTGKPFWDTYWWQHSEHERERVKQAFGRAVAGDVVRYDVQVQMAGGALMWIDFQIAPLRDDAGAITHVILSGNDLTASKQAEKESARLIAIIDATPDFIGMADAKGEVIYMSPGGRRLVGIAPDRDLSGADISEWHPQDAIDYLKSVAFPATIRDGTWEGETHLLDVYGRRIPVSAVFQAHHDEHGEIVNFSTIMRDISDIKRAEAQRSILMRELSHRVKNSLAVVQSIARQTLHSNPDPQSFVEVFEGRIDSLAASHALLTRSQWRGVGLREIILAQVDPVAGPRRDRITLDGSDIVLPAEAASQIGLVLHELATNAVKHGALGGPEGSVAISWRARPDWLDLVWRERGALCPVPPEAGGFGTMLIDMSAQSVTREYAQDGLTVTLGFEVQTELPVGQAR